MKLRTTITSLFAIVPLVLSSCSGGSDADDKEKKTSKDEEKTLPEGGNPASKRPGGLIDSITNKRKKTATATMVANLVNAVKMYETEYGVALRDQDADLDGDWTMDTAGTIIDILIGVDADLNPKEIRFIEFAENNKMYPVEKDEESGNTKLLDAWGRPFVVIVDLDYNGEIKVPHSDGPVNAGAVVYSKGPDPDDDSDDIKSW